jgi:hypothetical protein
MQWPPFTLSSRNKTFHLSPNTSCLSELPGCLASMVSDTELPILKIEMLARSGVV